MIVLEVVGLGVAVVTCYFAWCAIPKRSRDRLLGRNDGQPHPPPNKRQPTRRPARQRNKKPGRPGDRPGWE